MSNYNQILIEKYRDTNKTLHDSNESLWRRIWELNKKISWIKKNLKKEDLEELMFCTEMLLEYSTRSVIRENESIYKRTIKALEEIKK